MFTSKRSISVYLFILFILRSRLTKLFRDTTKNHISVMEVFEATKCIDRHNKDLDNELIDIVSNSIVNVYIATTYF